MNVIDSNELYFTTETSRTWNPDFHIHSFCEVYLLLNGEMDFFIADSRFRISPGTLIVINDYEIHKAVLVSGEEYKRCYIHIPPRYFQKFSSSVTDLSRCFYSRPPGKNNVFLLTPEQNRLFLGQLQRMTQLRLTRPFGYDLLIESCLIQILVMVSSLFSSGNTALIGSGPSYSAPVAQAVSYLSEHLGDALSLDQLSAACALEKHYLCRLFKKETGITPFRFLLLKRISLAKLLLSQGSSVTDACYRAGFQDYNNFITTFKKMTGVTPRQYRTQLLNEEA